VITGLRAAYRDAPLGKKISAIVLLCSALSVVLIGAAVYIFEYLSPEDRDDLMRLVASRSNAIGVQLQQPAFFLDNDEWPRELYELGQSSHVRILYVVVYTKEGKVFGEWPHGTQTLKDSFDADPGLKASAKTLASKPQSAYVFTRERRYVTAQRPLSIDNRLVGYANVIAESNYVNWARAMPLLPMILVAALLALLFARILKRSIVWPLEAVVEAAEKARAGEYSIHAEKLGNDETGRLIDSFNGMLVEVGRREDDLRRANEEAKAEGARADRANRAMLLFVSKINHDLRTALNSIVGFPEWILSEGPENLDVPQAFEDLKVVVAGCREMEILLDSTLDLARLESSQMTVESKEFDLSQLIADLQKLIRVQASVRKNQLDTVIDPTLHTIVSDYSKLRRILSNLLSNANKFTEGGTITLRAERSADSGSVILSVADTGCGMTREQQATLFQPFATTASRFGGAGLGLAIVHDFTDLLGGQVAVRSEPGKGSEFRIRLPLSEPAASELVQRVVSAPSVMVRPKRDRKLMLVIDDDPSVSTLVERIVAPEGIDVTSAHSGPEGLALARSLQPDIIVLDVILPGMNGWAVLTTLKADPMLSDIPVVLMTVVDDRSRGYALGASDFLVKPFDQDRLIAIARRYRTAAPSTVLVVEDKRESRQLLKRLLERESWHVEEAEDGAQALRWLAGHEPALILLDLIMPGMDGFTFVEELQRSPSRSSIPIIVLTAKELSTEERRRLQGGVDQILQKGSYTNTQLERVIRGLMAARGSREAS
jgi:signal transduction histidine kinase/DNA-binding response OmpR family regulator